MTRYDKPDYWALKAREEGYPARSVYKLKELDEKFGLFTGYRRGQGSGQTAAGRSAAGRSTSGRSALRVLDLGAAPGSWSL
ncbi:MAG: 50S rRNA methyltransferase, partial [Treponema sp.]|nr:50S rRNA methyltransferase [Treponema sp.]